MWIVKKPSPPALLLLGAVRLYQIFLSPLLGDNCRFHPSCSQYMLEAVERFGLLRGGLLGLGRLFRCGPWHPGGMDPVPEVWSLRMRQTPENRGPQEPPHERQGR